MSPRPLGSRQRAGGRAEATTHHHGSNGNSLDVLCAAAAALSSRDEATGVRGKATAGPTPATPVDGDTGPSGGGWHHPSSSLPPRAVAGASGGERVGGGGGHPTSMSALTHDGGWPPPPSLPLTAPNGVGASDAAAAVDHAMGVQLPPETHGPPVGARAVEPPLPSLPTLFPEASWDGGRAASAVTYAVPPAGLACSAPATFWYAPSSAGGGVSRAPPPVGVSLGGVSVYSDIGAAAAAHHEATAAAAYVTAMAHLGGGGWAPDAGAYGPPPYGPPPYGPPSTVASAVYGHAMAEAGAGGRRPMSAPIAVPGMEADASADDIDAGDGECMAVDGDAVGDRHSGGDSGGPRSSASADASWMSGGGGGGANAPVGVGSRHGASAGGTPQRSAAFGMWQPDVNGPPSVAADAYGMADSYRGGGGGGWGFAFAGGAYVHGGVGGGYAAPPPGYASPSPAYASPSYDSGYGMVGGAGAGRMSPMTTPTSLLPPSGGGAGDIGWPCKPSSQPYNYGYVTGAPRLQPPSLHGSGGQPPVAPPAAGTSPAPARPSRREGYTRFSRAEEAALSAGVLEYGAGSWKKILGAYPDFHPKRTPVCLKWRNLTRARMRRVHSASSGLSVASSGGGAGPPSTT
ncbi:hypothetical protein BU14_1399s0001 [Porphyra umbilicalis]|uniref:Myb-like domain-containing protein n=1 Tax=Porphyra umbilicalis TaxID=2786 RepID=A0A1X6NLW1_PORUM|nr:hypothetical protein BU14_1399s0001 [Porphyra umbilicalis]|eukprot:OSX69552.1 hypothetical protein BU14_1399s0001 [Porphyra umbilicalis]